MCQKRVMHIWLELYMWQKRYRQFKDFYWNRTCGKRGSNQTLEPYMWQNVHPVQAETVYIFFNQWHHSIEISVCLLWLVKTSINRPTFCTGVHLYVVATDGTKTFSNKKQQFRDIGSGEGEGAGGHMPLWFSTPTLQLTPRFSDLATSLQSKRYA